MKRLNRNAADAANPGATATAPNPAPPPAQAPVEPPPTGGTTALVPVGALLPGFTIPENMEPDRGDAPTWVGFYEQRMRGGRAAAIVAQLGPQSDGAPFFCSEGKYYSMQGLNYVVLTAFPFWATYDESAQGPGTVWLANPGVKKQGDTRINEHVLAVILIVPGQAGLPPSIAHLHAIPATCDFRGPKAPAVKAVLEAAQASTDPAAAQRLGALVNLDPRFRQMASLATTYIPARGPGSYPYVRAEARLAAPTQPQLAALQRWNAEGGGPLREVMDHYNARCEELEDMAEPPQPK